MFVINGWSWHNSTRSSRTGKLSWESSRPKETGHQFPFMSYFYFHFYQLCVSAPSFVEWSFEIHEGDNNYLFISFVACWQPVEPLSPICRFSALVSFFAYQTVRKRNSMKRASMRKQQPIQSRQCSIDAQNALFFAGSTLVDLMLVPEKHTRTHSFRCTSGCRQQTLFTRKHHPCQKF